MLSRGEASEKVICALDCPLEEGLALARALEGRLRWVKVGMTMFYREGPRAVELFRELGLKVFLDLKLFDIPFQVEGAAASAAATGADLLSVHALGAAEMLEAAVRGARSGREGSKVIAISVLTSMDDDSLASIGIERPVEREVRDLARLAWGAGVDGMVCSPREVAALREALGDEAILVAPGVRPAGAALGDQRRVATPGEAVAAGASMVVVGRPLTAAENPKAAFDAIVDQIASAL